ncbi:MAG: UvrD-helicase domain-containing protein [Thermoplasmatota archaeon]
MELTRMQELALDINRNIAVTAGAGSGKTRVLVERYISILEKDPGIRPKNILALTFTEKAASEMKERIRKSIRERYRDDPVRWFPVMEELDSADISTIHSFCTRIVRTEPVPCGVDPDFRVITETESAELLRDTINSLLTTDGPESPSLRRLLVDYGLYNTTRTLKELMKERARSRLDMGSAEFARRSLEKLDMDHERKLSEAISGLEEILPGLISIKDIPVPDVPRDTAVPLMKALQPLFRKLDGHREGAGWRKELLGLLWDARDHMLTARGNVRGVARLGNSSVWKENHGRLKECFGMLFPFVRGSKEILPFVTDPSLLERTRERLMDLLMVFSVMVERFQERKREHNGLDFDDQISLALELLRTNEGSMLESLRRRYRHLLVDEFQDTDPRQWELVNLLWDGGSGSRLFIVGDPKQSIYGFRSADVRLFLEAKERIDEHGDGSDVVLDLNFRSREEIIELVNHIFPDIMEEGSKRWGVPFDPLDACRPGGGTVTLVGVLGARGAEAREGRKAAELIKRAVRNWTVSDGEGERPVCFGDIAILLPTRNGIRHYEDALRLGSVPYQIYKGKGLFERQEVSDIMSLLSFCSDPTDDLSLASLLKGPFFGLSDEDLIRISRQSGSGLLEKLGGLEEFRDDHGLVRAMLEVSGALPPHIALREIFEMTAVYASLGGAREARNFDRMLNWAMDESSAATTGELAERLRRVVTEPPKEGEPPMDFSEDSVTVMTIHSAKGLEWPVVLVLGMNHEMKGGGWTPPYILDPDAGLSLKVMDTRNGELVPSPSFSHSREDAEQKETEELKRLLYVACTRAKDHLVLSGAVKIRSRDDSGELSGMFKLLWNSLDLSIPDLQEGVKLAGSVTVNLVEVKQEDLAELVEEEEEASPVAQVPSGSHELPLLLPLVSGKHTFLSSPSRILKDGMEKRELDFDYPDLLEGPGMDVMGDMVHAVLQGIPLERVLAERGAYDRKGEVELMVREFGKKLEEEGIERIGSEVEVVGVEKEPMLGRIDLLGRDREGLLVVVDFKTGRQREEHLEQVKLYSSLLEKVLKERVREKVLYLDGSG